MSRLGYAIDIFEREHARLWAWANTYVDQWSADAVTYAAFSSLMWSGVSGRHTSKGTVPGLYLAAEGPLRRAVESRGGYLPAGAWKAAPWPSLREALELAELYSTWVYVHIAADFGWQQRHALADALRAFRSGRMLVPTGNRAAAEDALIMKTLALVASFLFQSAPQDARAAERAREVWHRERYRTHATYRARELHTAGAADGEGQQDHDSRVAWEAHGVDNLVGLWAVRPAQPEPGVRDDPEPATDLSRDR